MPEFFNQFMHWSIEHPLWLAGAIFLITLLECLAIIGILVPGVSILLALAALAGQGVLSLPAALVLTSLGAIAGNFASYGLGLRLQHKAERLPLLRRRPHWLVQAQIHLDSYGAGGVFLGQFIGPVRPFLPLVAGMLKMSKTKFLTAIIPASLLWSMLLMLPGWAFASASQLSPPQGFWWQLIISSLAFILLAAVASYCSLRQLAGRQLYLALLASLLLLGFSVALPLLSSMDTYLLTLGQSIRSPALDQLMLLITMLGDRYVQLAIFAALGGLLLLYRAWTALAYAVSCAAITVLANALLKKLIARARPDLLLEPLSGYSFPSGHTSRAFLLAMVIACLLSLTWRSRWKNLAFSVLLAIASLIGISRVYLTAHWPTDIMAAALLAIGLCSAISAAFTARWPLQQLPARFWQPFAALCLAIFSANLLLNLSATASKYAY